jgi:hypothetical protein
MTFEEVLDQAMAMLQRRGRVTYRTLQLQFTLDDEQLAPGSRKVLPPSSPLRTGREGCPSSGSSP